MIGCKEETNQKAEKNSRMRYGEIEVTSAPELSLDYVKIICESF